MICPEKTEGRHVIKHITKNSYFCSCGCVFDWENKKGMKILKHSKNFVKSELVVREIEKISEEELQIEDPEKEEAQKAVAENRLS